MNSLASKIVMDGLIGSGGSSDIIHDTPEIIGYTVNKKTSIPLTNKTELNGKVVVWYSRWNIACRNIADFVTGEGTNLIDISGGYMTIYTLGFSNGIVDLFVFNK